MSTTVCSYGLDAFHEMFQEFTDLNVVALKDWQPRRPVFVHEDRYQEFCTRIVPQLKRKGLRDRYDLDVVLMYVTNPCSTRPDLQYSITNASIRIDSDGTIVDPDRLRALIECDDRWKVVLGIMSLASNNPDLTSFANSVLPLNRGLHTNSLDFRHVTDFPETLRHHLGVGPGCVETFQRVLLWKACSLRIPGLANESAIRGLFGYNSHRVVM